MDFQNCSVNQTDKVIKQIQVSKKVNYTQIELEPVIAKYNIDPECQYYDSKKLKGNLFQNMDSFKIFQQYFKDNCFNQTNCTFDTLQIGDLGLWNLISPGCKNRMNQTFYPNITSPIYIALVGCKYDKIQMPFTTSNEFRAHKLDVGLVIVAFDMLSFFIIMYFLNLMKNFNDEYIEKVSMQVVSMKDFGIKIDKLLLDKYSQDQRLVRMKIWLHFTNLLKDRVDIYNDMECIDVCLSLYNELNIQLVFRMQEVQLEINQITAKLKAGQYKYDEVPDKQIELNRLIEKIKRFETRYKKITQKQKQDPDKLQVMKIAKNQKIKEIDYVFVVFKNSQTRLQIKDIYGDKQNATLNFLKKMFIEDGQMSENKLLFGKEPDIVNIIEPDEIIWENLGYTGDQQKARNFIMKIIQFLSIIINLIITIYVSAVVTLISKYIPNLNCPTFEIQKDEAYIDLFKPKPSGFMGCWCQSNTKLFLLDSLLKSNFSEFSNLNYKLNPLPDPSKQNDTAPQLVQDTYNYCLNWWILNYTKQIALFILGLTAVFINEIIAAFFKFMGQFQKSHTRIEEQILAFQKIFFMEYINMGLIILVTSFDSIGIYTTLIGDLASSKPAYNGFEPNWYMDYGNRICISIFMSSIILNVNEIREYLKVIAKRCIDRKGKLNLKLDPLDEDCDLPNTFKKVQKDLVDLYTGKGFTGEKVFSRLMSTMFVIIMYSSGIPIFYLIGLAFFTFTYITNKYMLIYYFKKSTTLTRNIPIFGIDSLQYVLYIHLIVSIFMFTDNGSFMTRSTEGSIKSPIDIQSILTVLLSKYDTTVVDSNVIQQQQINPIAQFFLDRIKFLHQQLIIGFAVLFVAYKLVGSTIFRILYILSSEFIKCAQSFLEKRKRQAQQAIMKHMQKVQTQNQIINYEFEQDINDQENRIQIQQEIQQDNNEAEKFLMNKSKKNQFKKKQDQLQEQLQKQEKEQFEEQRNASIAIKKQENPNYSDNIYAEFSPQNLQNLYQRSKRELVDFWDIFQWDKIIGDEITNPESQSPYRILFLETCYTYRITQQNVLDYQEFLLRRIDSIEKQINSYFELLKPQLINKIKESFAQDQRQRKKKEDEGTLEEQLMQKKYEEWYFVHSNDVQWDDSTIYTFQRKLKLLIEFYDDLIRQDKQSKFNRKGIQTICRMSGSNVQSYFILDSAQYKVGRSIYFSIESTIPKVENNLDQSSQQQSEYDNEDDISNEQSLISSGGKNINRINQIKTESDQILLIKEKKDSNFLHPSNINNKKEKILLNYQNQENKK